MTNHSKHKGVDIFSGAGGMSLGAIAAGIEIVLAIDNDKPSSKTYKKNHPDTQFICADIRNINPLDYIENEEDVFIVFGGPPCQGFSTSNTRTRNSENPNNHLFKEFVRFIDKIRPKWFVFENVGGITKFNKGKTIQDIQNAFKDLGYTTKHSVLCASDYGVPQHRNRFFLVGNRENIEFEFPEKENRVVTVEDAISDLPELQNGDKYDSLPYSKKNDLSAYAMEMRVGSECATQNYVSLNKDYIIERYKYIGQGENWQAIPKELMSNYTNTNNCHSGIYKRLDPLKPSVVISNYRKNMLIHPIQDRGLSVREAARLQSFPDNFIFDDALINIQQQIGNAVPPRLAEKVFIKILSY